MVRPIDFMSDSPPPRTIGTECEYNMQAPDGVNYNHHFTAAQNMTNRGINNHKGYLGNEHGGGKAYPDVGHLEFDTSEAVGPAAAAVKDIRGIQQIGDIIKTDENVVHSGLYRLSGTFIPKESSDDQNEEDSSGSTSGYHENYLVARDVTYNPLIDQLLPTVVASRLWAMSGTLHENGFVLSQKVWGVGGNPIERSLNRRTDHGQKPMITIPQSYDDGDTIGDTQWARIEVRMADPGLSLAGRFAAFANMSLSLRLIEQSQRIGPEKIGALCLLDPVRAAKRYAADLSLGATAETAEGRSFTALDVQESLLDVLEPLSESVSLPIDEKFALGTLRGLVDALRASQPSSAEYSPLSNLRVEFAAKHRFISDGDDQAKVKASSQKHQQRALLWDRVLPEGNGVRYWQRVEKKDPLIGPIKHMAESAGTLPRARRRADMVDRNNGERVVSWSQYLDRNGQLRSLGNPIGD